MRRAPALASAALASHVPGVEPLRRRQLCSWQEQEIEPQIPIPTASVAAV
eukprot:SAG22_NODE_17814_length_298_cov_0.698492_1_plen_49_part_10